MTPISITVRGAIERAMQRFELPDSETAVRLLLMIAAHESGGFLYCKQNKGPALGLFQMEPNTYEFCISYLKRTGRFPKLTRTFRAERMLVDTEFAAAFARVYLASIPEPLPNDPDDLDALAAYAKKYWNTEAGAATPGKYKRDFLRHVWGEAV